MKALDSPIRGCITTAFNELMIFKVSQCTGSQCRQLINEEMLLQLPINLLSVTTVRLSCFGYDGPVAGGMSQTGRGSIATGELFLRPEAHIIDNPLVSRRRSSYSHRKDFPACVSLGFVDLGVNSNHSTAVTQFTRMMTEMRKPITCWHLLQPKVVKRKSIAGSPHRQSYGPDVEQQPPPPIFSAPVASPVYYQHPSNSYHATTQPLYQDAAYTSISIDPTYHYENHANHMFVNS